MAKEKAAVKASFLHELFQFDVYKPSQGKLVRQVTFAAIAVTCLLGCWQLMTQLRSSDWLQDLVPAVHYVVPGTLLLVGLWVAYRVVNYTKFADFLISVEAELSKVSWPNRSEVTRSAIVVIFVIFALAGLLFAFDLLWQFIFRLEIISVIQTGRS